EYEPGKLIFISKRHKRSPVVGFEAVDVEGGQLGLGVVEATFRLPRFLLGLMLGDEHITVGTAGLLVEVSGPLRLESSFLPVVTERTDNGADIWNRGRSLR